MEKGKSWFITLIGYAGGERGKFVLSIILSVTGIVSGILPYFCIFIIIKAFAAGTLTTGIVLTWCGLSLLFLFVKEIFFTLSTALSHKVAYSVVRGLRLKVAGRFLKAPLGEVQRNTIGQIKDVLVDRVENIEPPLAHVVPEGAGHIVLPVVSITALALIDWRIALASLVTFPAAIICMMLTFRISGDSFRKYSESNAYMNSTIVEYIEGIEVIKAFGRAGVSYEKYASAIEDYRTFLIKWMKSTWVTMKLSFALFPSTLLGTLPVALYLAVKGTIAPEETALAAMLSMSMVKSLAKLEVFTENIREMKGVVEEVERFLTMDTLPEPERNIETEGCGIRFEDVRFSYGENEVLHGIDLEMPEGSFTALVGPSGSGKSTVAKLISRFWDVGSGRITIGGRDIREMPLRQLTGLVSFVTQDNFLFRGSIMENIRLGDPSATDEEVIAAAEAAQCGDFIAELPSGYDTPAGEAGSRLSGGEKQRIAIARMMLKDSPVVILDEATAFTDPENEDRIQRSIGELTKGKTLLVIAHRLSTIRKADNIVVLDGGRIEAQGTQEELLEGCPLYRKMWAAHTGARNWAVRSDEGKEEGYVHHH